MPAPVRLKPIVALSAAFLAAFAWTTTALAQGTRGGLAPIEPQSVNASRIEDVYWFILGVSAFVFLLVAVPLLIFIVKYRSNGRPRTVEGPQVRGNTGFELAWTAVPIVILAAITAFVFYKLPGIVDPAGTGEEQHVVRVEGRQFYWQYEYENGVIGIDELRVPLGRTTLLRLTAPEGDVIHSFWAPALMGKRDTIPGQLTRLRILPTREGTYRVFCGEFCGLQHTAMRGAVVVMPAEEFDAWLGQQLQAQQEQPTQLGGAIWTGACQKCHAAELQLAPQLEGNPILDNPEAVAQIVRNGRGAMPAVGQGWTEEQMNALLEFARALAPGGGNGDG
jgi:cytochrome c oxidase subunit II